MLALAQLHRCSGHATTCQLVHGRQVFGLRVATVAAEAILLGWCGVQVIQMQHAKMASRQTLQVVVQLSDVIGVRGHGPHVARAVGTVSRVAMSRAPAGFWQIAATFHNQHASSPAMPIKVALGSLVNGERAVTSAELETSPEASFAPAECTPIAMQPSHPP
jgi:hypothetical protein